MSERKADYILPDHQFLASLRLPPEQEIEVAHELLDKAGIPRFDNRGMQHSVPERVAYLIGKCEVKCREAWSAGVIDALKE